jgi:Family of unknown function (DUF5681)
MHDAVNNAPKHRPFQPGQSGNVRGRPKGSKNKTTRDLIEATQAAGETPLDYMLRVMRDPNAPAEPRDLMARSAAPFLHPRRVPEHADVNTPIVVMITQAESEL